MTVSASLARRALARRLSAVVQVLSPQYQVPDGVAEDPAAVVDLIEAVIGDQVRADRTWATLTAIAAAYPKAAAVDRTRRALELAEPSQRPAIVLREAQALLAERGNPFAGLTVVTGQKLIDVSFCATQDQHTGIQRTVRSTVPHWIADGRAIHLVAWGDGDGAYRDLTPLETARVSDWHGVRPPASEPTMDIVMPWNTTVVIPEVTGPDQSAVLSSMAMNTPNRFALIGYDCIPVVAADTMPLNNGEFFVHYLAFVKHADLVVGISRSAAAEFAGFGHALPTQGLTGPRIETCALPVEFPAAASRRPVDKTDPPTITCIGRHETRKNHNAVLTAAERLWREGLEFRVRLIGGGAPWDQGGFQELLALLQAQGRAVSAEQDLPDEAIWDAYRQSRFTVFPSLHEGYGLPVAESLALGVPALTTNYGSTLEIALDGGCVLIDPRSDEEIVGAMRQLLTDDALIAELTAQAKARPERTWKQYADELWTHIEGAGDERA